GGGPRGSRGRDRGGCPRRHGGDGPVASSHRSGGGDRGRRGRSRGRAAGDGGARSARPDLHPRGRMSEKTRPEQLAIFGGPPAFAEADALHVGRPNVGDRRRLLDRIADAVEQRRLTNDGPYVLELERR